MFTSIIASKVLSFAKNPYVIGILVVLLCILYHLYKVNSLESSLSDKEKAYLELDNKYQTVLKINKNNSEVMSKVKRDMATTQELCEGVVNNKDATIDSLKTLLLDNKKIQYESTYVYDKCQFKTNGDNNESSELYKIINSIGK